MDEHPPPRSQNTVLVGIGSEKSRRILEYVAALELLHDSEVIIFHVHEKAYSGPATLDVGPTAVISASDAAAELGREGIRARAVDEDAYWGHTADAIIKAADRYSAKAIVIGTKGRSKMSAVVLGSVAYKVLHLSRVPVLVIP